MRTIVLFTGLPGVGKSTLSYRLAEQTGWALLSKDQIDRSLEIAEVKNGRAAYEVLLGLTDINIKHNSSVILDAVFGYQRIRDQVLTIANKHDAKVFVIYCICSDDELWMKRVAKRQNMVEGWTAAEWKEVERVKSYFETLTLPHVVIDTKDYFDQNMEKILAYING